MITLAVVGGTATVFGLVAKLLSSADPSPVATAARVQAIQAEAQWQINMVVQQAMRDMVTEAHRARIGHPE